MSQQSKEDLMTRKLLTTMYDMGLPPNTRVKIIKTIIHSKDEDKTTIAIQKILDTSKTEEEILEKIQKI